MRFAKEAAHHSFPSNTRASRWSIARAYSTGALKLTAESRTRVCKPTTPTEPDHKPTTRRSPLVFSLLTSLPFCQNERLSLHTR